MVKTKYNVGEHVYLTDDGKNHPTYKGIFKIIQKCAGRSCFVPTLTVQRVTDKFTMAIYETEILRRVQQTRLEKLGLKRKKVNDENN